MPNNIETQVFTLNGKQVEINIEQFDQDPGFVWTHIFREPFITEFAEVEPQNLQNKAEFFEDVQNFLDNLNGKEISRQSIWDAHAGCCSKHIDLYGQLVDVDIESLLDCTLRCVIAISKTYGMPPLTSEQGITLRKDFRGSTYRAARKFIMISRGSDLVKFESLPEEKQNEFKYMPSKPL